MRSSFPFVLTILTALGCQQQRAQLVPEAGRATPEVSAVGVTTVTSAQTPTVEARMKEHFVSSVAMRHTLLKGDLDGFRAAAATLSDKEIPANMSGAWSSNLEAMRTAATRARDAQSLDAGARAFTDLGLACASCHEKLGGPKLTVGEPPARGSGTKLHMARHDWAAARLWDGLMAPSDEAWRKGAEVFTDAPLEPQVIAGAKSVPPEVNELAKRAHAFGEAAHMATGQTARAKAVADVYGTCVGCHSKLGVAIQ
jgi:cytochrome c553